MSNANDWLDYAFSMADMAGANGREFTLVANRLEALALPGEVEERLHNIARATPGMGESEAARAARGLYGELTHWLLEFMIAASYVRKVQGLTQDELAVAVGRWFSRFGEELPETRRRSIAFAILVKSLLNDAKPFVVASATSKGVTMVEAPLLVRVEHGRYYVTDEAENYLYHIDSTIDEFASDYSLMAARMGRELDSRSYDKSSRTVKDMITRVGHVRRQMNTLVEDTGRLGPDDQWERYNAIRQSVETIRAHRDVGRRYREEVARIWESWDAGDALDHVRETHIEQLANLRSLEEGLRVLAAVESWMYDEYASLSDRCEQVTKHYLRSSVVTTLFSLDDLLENVVHTNVEDLDWLENLLLPVTRPKALINFAIPPQVTLDDMLRSPKSDEPADTMDLQAMLEDLDADTDEAEAEHALDLARRFAAWLKMGGGSLGEWMARQQPEQIYADMESHDLTRLIGSFLADTTTDTSAAEAAPIASFADRSWLAQLLPLGSEGLMVEVEAGDDVVRYEGRSEQGAVRGLLDNLQFEVIRNA